MNVKPPKLADKTTQNKYRDKSGRAYDFDDYMRWQQEMLVQSVIKGIRNNPELQRELKLALEDKTGDE